jgi:lysine/ornithine N-monooxygenase
MTVLTQDEIRDKITINGKSLTLILEENAAMMQCAAVEVAARVEQIELTLRDVDLELALEEDGELDQELVSSKSEEMQQLLLEIDEIATATGYEYSFDTLLDDIRNLADYDYYNSTEMFGDLVSTAEDMSYNIEAWNRSYC